MPKYKANKAIVYTVTEDAISGYASEITGDMASGFIVKNTNTETVSVDVTKQWVGKTGESATIRLLADGVETQSVELNQANSWKHSFTDLPKYKANKAIVYTVTEDAISGYTTEITGDMTSGFVVKNTNTETVSVDVTKQWVGKTGESATVNLFADGRR
ncbi:MAG: hypothetical protein CSB19_02575 [Clostridiales bacterium]|nr:MAG: hypothetical protein CSB19_02575 [Clostridiales bacterium]